MGDDPRTEFGCRRVSVPTEQPEPLFCPYCGNQSLITVGEELRQIEADFE